MDWRSICSDADAILGTINVPMDELGELAEERKICAWSGLLTL